MEKFKIKEIKDLTNKDLVKGTDNQWHSIETLEIQEKQMYLVKTEYGDVESSYDHYWTLFSPILRRKKEIQTEDLIKYYGWHIGAISGPVLVEIVKTTIKPCRCISVDSEDHQFEILTNENIPLFTHNCGARMVCGRLGSTASLMALGSSLATTVDGSHKGRGIVSSQGEITGIQYYFTDGFGWIENWWKERGFDENGYAPEDKAVKAIELSGEEEIKLTQDKTEYEFDDIKKEVDKSLEQVFEEI